MTLEEFRSLLGQALDFYNSEHTSTEIDEGVSGGLGAVRYDIPQTLAEAQKATARMNLGIEGGGAGGGNFEAVYDVTTAAEIEAAYQAGMTITMNNNGVIFYLRERSNENLFVFATAPYYVDLFKEIYIYTATVDGITWSSSLTKAEPISNKVTTIDENSTNKQYPSAKAVFDFVNENSGGGSGADLLNENGIIKQEYLPEGYPYVGESTLEVIIPETSFVAENVDGVGMGQISESATLTIGETYIVNWNGTEYSCVARDGTELGESGYILGNVGALTGGTSTGEPFILMILPPDLAAEQGAGCVIISLAGPTSGTLAVLHGSENITVIAEKFLPEGYPYPIPGGKIILEETTLTPLGIMEAVDVRFNLSNGYTYEVVFNGTPYTVKSYKICYTGVLLQFIGNPYLVQETYADNNIPFAFIAEGGAVCFVGYNNNSATVSITEERNYEKIDTNYLPSETVFVDVYGEIGTSTTEGNITRQSHENAEIISLAAIGKNVILRNYFFGESNSYYSYYLIGFNGTQAQFSRTRTESGRINGETITVRPGKIEIVTATVA